LEEKTLDRQRKKNRRGPFSPELIDSPSKKEDKSFRGERVYRKEEGHHEKHFERKTIRKKKKKHNHY